VFKELEAKIVRWNILDTGKRIDGRDAKTVRNIVCEVGVLPRAHGSALFTRRRDPGDGGHHARHRARTSSIFDALSGTYKRRSCCTTISLPTRSARPDASAAQSVAKIGHGKLAWRAIHPILPPHHEFPYTVRVVSEITESNGSSSMASVCGASLALMDAGVPLKRPTAGIAMA